MDGVCMKVTTFTIPSFLGFEALLALYLPVSTFCSATIERQVSLTRNGLRNTALSTRKVTVLLRRRGRRASQ
jgi:hypothetical protein